MNRNKRYGSKSFLAVVLSVMLIQPTVAASPISSGNKLALDAKKQIGVTVSYDPAYRKLAFPRGDVPIETGVCTDMIVRAYRLQNIDHRRVPNLEVYFERHGQSLSITDKDSFKAGDIVTWQLPNGNLPHIGIVSDNKAANGTPLIIHNIGRGTQEENILFAYPITKHFRY